MASKYTSSCQNPISDDYDMQQAMKEGSGKGFFNFINQKMDKK